MDKTGLRNRRWWIWVLLAFISALTLAGAVLMYLARAVPLKDQWGFRGIPISFVATYSAVGALILFYRPRNPIGWMFLSFGLISAIDFLGEEYATYSFFIAPDRLPGESIGAWLSSWVWVLEVGPILTYMPLIFPDGRLPSPRWRPVALASVAVTIWMAIGVALNPVLEPRSAIIANPFGLESHAQTVSALFLVSLAAGIGVSILSIAALFTRYRRGNRLERQQIKWLLYACLLGVIFAIPGLYGGWIGELLFFIATQGITAAVAIAILYYHLFNIDLIIRRTLVYSVLTISLALFYFANVLALTELIQEFTGQSGQSTLANVLSTLGIAAVFTPLRHRIQHGLDRRFYRKKYDSKQIVDELNAKLRDEVDLEELSQRLLEVVEQTLQPEHATLWVRPAKGYHSQVSRE